MTADLRDWQTRKLMADEATELLDEAGPFMTAVRALEKRSMEDIQNRTMNDAQLLQVCADLRALGWIPAVLKTMTSKKALNG